MGVTVVILTTVLSIIVANSNCENIWIESFMHCKYIFYVSEDGKIPSQQLQKYCQNRQSDENCKARNMHCGSPHQIKNFKFDQPIICEEMLITKKLKRIPSKFFYNETTIFTDYLRLDNLGIREIEESAFFGLENVTTLYLQNNLIETINRPVFSDLYTLRLLYLENNPIKHLGDQSFVGLGKLNLLSLKKNDLANIENGVFKPLPLLDTLVLDGTQLRNVGFNILQFSQKLEILEMQNSRLILKTLTTAPKELGLSNDTLFIPCSLKSIYLRNLVFESVGDLNCIQNLEYLDLSRNRLKDFKGSAIFSLKNLEFFSLAYNYIRKLDESLFQNRQKLRTLHLHYNNIEHIPKDIFKSVNNLDTLRLDGNKIKELSAKVFDGLLFLQSLNISSNQLTTLDGMQNLQLNNLNELYIDHNNLKCTNINLELYPELKVFYFRGNPWKCPTIDQLYVELKTTSELIETDINLTYFLNNTKY